MLPFVNKSCKELSAKHSTSAERKHFICQVNLFYRRFMESAFTCIDPTPVVLVPSIDFEPAKDAYIAMYMKTDGSCIPNTFTAQGHRHFFEVLMPLFHQWLWSFLPPKLLKMSTIVFRVDQLKEIQDENNPLLNGLLSTYYEYQIRVSDKESAHDWVRTITFEAKNMFNGNTSNDRKRRLRRELRSRIWNITITMTPPRRDSVSL